MPPTYRIRNWDALFETSETRKLKHLAWVPIPNKHDGKGYHQLMASGAEFFAAWILVLQVASRCSQRGLLEDQDGPLTVEDLEVKTHLPAKSFQKALERLVEIGWMEVVDDQGHPITPADPPGTPADPPGTPVLNRTELNRTELNRTEEKGGVHFVSSPARQIFDLYNELCGTKLPKARDFTQERAKKIKAALNVHGEENLRKLFSLVVASDFLTGANDRGWRADFDWIFKSGNMVKILEGRYENRPKGTKYSLPGESIQYGRGGIALPTEADLVMQKKGGK